MWRMVLFIMSLVILVAAPVLAAVGGGDIILKGDGGGPVVFSHDRHVADAGLKCQECHTKSFVALPVVPCKECHEGGKGLHAKGDHKDLNCTECHKPHSWAITSRDLCLGCHSDMKDHNKPTVCTKCHDFRGRKI